jgi:hypothetical protein
LTLSLTIFAAPPVPAPSAGEEHYGTRSLHSARDGMRPACMAKSRMIMFPAPSDRGALEWRYNGRQTLAAPM